MLIQYAKEELQQINNRLCYMRILGCTEEQLEKDLQRREYLMAVIEQFEEVGV